MKNTFALDHRSPWPVWAATAIGLLGLAGLASAQGTSRPIDIEELLPVESIASTDVPAPISDDGRHVGLVPVVNELIVQRTSASTVNVHVEVLGEWGRRVRSIAHEADARRAFAVPLSDLPPGRYVALVQAGGRVDVVRFRKER